MWAAALPRATRLGTTIRAGGWIALLTPALAMLILGWVLREAVIFAHANNTFTYDAFFRKLWDPYPKLEISFEIFFLIMLFVAVGVAIAGAASLFVEQGILYGGRSAHHRRHPAGDDHFRGGHAAPRRHVDERADRAGLRHHFRHRHRRPVRRPHTSDGYGQTVFRLSLDAFVQGRGVRRLPGGLPALVHRLFHRGQNLEKCEHADGYGFSDERRVPEYGRDAASALERPERP